MKKACGVLILVGILLFLIGTGAKHETEVQSYHRVYKDQSGTWRGSDVSYLSDSPNGLETFGVVLAIAGGVGLSISKKSDK